ncbi:MAG TPA: YfhO family protein [Blastocatellia bacterium]|nr:YfhO family protein [Blastocatellia bacterium]
MNVEPEVETRASATLATSRAAHRFAHAVNIAIMLLAIVALFGRVLFLGETLIDANTLNNQLPWGYNAGKSDYPYNRRDLTDTYITRDYFVVSAYRDGEFPLWNPYTMAGHPIYADGVSRTLSPFLVFYKFFDVPLGYSLARISELTLAMIFMYIFLVAIGAGAYGALIGSLVFGFSVHSMFHVTGLGWWGGLMWLPLILLFASRAIIARSQASSVRNALLAGIFLAAQFFCGYLPNQIYYLGVVVLFYLFFARGGGAARRSVGSAVAMLSITLAVGLALSATQWAPALELLSHSNRKIVGAELGYVWLPPWYAATLVFPNLFGSAYDAKMLTLFTALGVSHDHILYLGITALTPIGFSLHWLRQKRKERGSHAGPETGRPGEREAERYIIFFAGIAVFSLIIMMAAPLYVPITRYIPILQVIRVAVRAGVLFLFASAVLTAFGIDLLLKADVDALKRFVRIALRFIFVVACFVALAVIASYIMRLGGLAVDTVERGSLAFIGRAAFALSAQFRPPAADIRVPLVFLLVAAVLLWELRKGWLSHGAFVYCTVVLLLIDLSWIGAPLVPNFDRSVVFPRTEITDLLQSLPSGRVLVVPSDLETNRRLTANEDKKIIAPPNTLLPYRISTVTGKNQQFPRWYREFASLIEPQPNLSHVVFDQYRSRFFDLLNVRYVMTHESTPLQGYELLATAEGVSLYENKNALPRAFFVDQVVEVDTHADAMNLLSQSDFDPRSTAVVELTAPMKVVSGRIINSQFRTDNSTRYATLFTRMQLLLDLPVATVVEDRRNSVSIHTENGTDGTLILNDNYYPGWQASIDGVPVQIFRANCTMRAINVPAGRHVVSFVFKPAAFFVSMYVSVAAAALTVLVLILSAAKQKRE